VKLRATSFVENETPVAIFSLPIIYRVTQARRQEDVGPCFTYFEPCMKTPWLAILNHAANWGVISSSIAAVIGAASSRDRIVVASMIGMAASTILKVALIALVRRKS
jgi:hypothetical protein